jgi:hypothetical protein
MLQDQVLFILSGMTMSLTRESNPVQVPEKRIFDAIEVLTLLNKAAVPIFGSLLSELQYAC